MPLIFPQYGRASGIVAYAGASTPTVPADGFLNRLHWSVVDAGVSPNPMPDPAPSITLSAMATPETYEVWPYKFEAMYTVCYVFGSSPVPFCKHLRLVNFSFAFVCPHA